MATGGINFHSLAGKAPFTATQQDSKFGILEMQFSNNKLDAKFISNAGSTMDHFTVTKTTKKPTSLTPSSTPAIAKSPGIPKVVDKKSEDSQKIKNATKLNENQPANDKSTKKVDKKSEDSQKIKNATKLNENQPANDKDTKKVDKKSEDSQKIKNATKLNENQPANDKSTKKVDKKSEDSQKIKNATKLNENQPANDKEYEKGQKYI